MYMLASSRSRAQLPHMRGRRLTVFVAAANSLGWGAPPSRSAPLCTAAPRLDMGCVSVQMPTDTACSSWLHLVRPCCRCSARLAVHEVKIIQHPPRDCWILVRVVRGEKDDLHLGKPVSAAMHPRACARTGRTTVVQYTSFD